jgi:diguanylate cyclase (GGDEF)-like protein
MLILLAEDSKTLALALRRKFEAMGHEVALAEDGQAAVHWFASGCPDLVVMDIDMPRMDGFTAAKKIREMERLAGDEGSWTPIVFLTATDTVENLLMAIDAGGDDFLPKTAPDAVLGAKISAMGRIAGLMARLKSLSSENEALAAQAATDAMTHLPNRRALDARLAQSQAREQGGLGLLMIDVDHFKKYNDGLGHAAGDACLSKIGEALAAEAKEAGVGVFAARYGGEEFAMLIENSNPKKVMELADGICRRVRSLGIAHPENEGQSVVTVSVGASMTGLKGSPKEALRRADKALYAAKAQGRARACWEPSERGGDSKS